MIIDSISAFVNVQAQEKRNNPVKGAQTVDSKTAKNALTINETAKEFDFPAYAIRTLVKRGAFPVIQVGNRCYIVRSVFEQYLQKGGELYEPIDHHFAI